MGKKIDIRMRNNPRIWFRVNVSGMHGPPGVERGLFVQVGSRIATLASEPSIKSYPIFTVNENVVAAPLAMRSQDLSQKLSSHVRTDIASVCSGARLRSALPLASLTSRFIPAVDHSRKLVPRKSSPGSRKYPATWQAPGWSPPTFCNEMWMWVRQP